MIIVARCWRDWILHGSTATIAAAVGLLAGNLGWNIFAGSALDLALTIVWVVGQPMSRMLAVRDAGIWGST
ncbi:MAG: hypothetical protein LC798_21450 [Chloroflexi bacterium]|nr:hypothetical protein [Chloroflexota bacterium]